LQAGQVWIVVVTAAELTNPPGSHFFAVKSWYGCELSGNLSLASLLPWRQTILTCGWSFGNNDCPWV